MGIGLAGLPAARHLRCVVGGGGPALTRHLDEPARDAIFGGTATRFYRIETGRGTGTH